MTPILSRAQENRSNFGKKSDGYRGHSLDKSVSSDNARPSAREGRNLYLSLLYAEYLVHADKTVAGAAVADTARYNNDSTFRAAANAAPRAAPSAAMNPQCQPWPLPDGQFEQ